MGSAEMKAIAPECPYCGSEHASGKKVCGFCEKPLASESEPTRNTRRRRSSSLSRDLTGTGFKLVCYLFGIPSFIVGFVAGCYSFYHIAAAGAFLLAAGYFLTKLTTRAKELWVIFIFVPLTAFSLGCFLAQVT